MTGNHETDSMLEKFDRQFMDIENALLYHSYEMVENCGAENPDEQMEIMSLMLESRKEQIEILRRRNGYLENLLAAANSAAYNT